LSMIVMTQTSTGRERWDTPEVKVAAGKKSKMRKDRYSSLIMANMAARTLARMPTPEEYTFFGGFASTMPKDSKQKNDEKMFTGPNWFTENMKDIY